MSFSKNLGKALENLVFLELKRRGEEATKIRELKGLLNTCKSFGQNSGLIITADFEDSFEIEGVKVEVIPFFKWCLINRG